MLYQLLLYWLYMAVVLFSAGYFALRILSAFTRKKVVDYAIDQPIYLGLSVITTIACLLNFFLKISPEIHVVVVSVLFFFLIMDHRAVLKYFSARLLKKHSRYHSFEDVAGPLQKNPRVWHTVGLGALAFSLFVVTFFELIGPTKEIKQEQRISIEISVSKPDFFQIFFDIGNGIREEDSIRLRSFHANTFETLDFRLPPFELINNLRFDPVRRPGEVILRAVTINDRRLTGESLRDALSPTNHIEYVKVRDNLVYVKSTGNDPILYFTRPMSDFLFHSGKTLNLSFIMAVFLSGALALTISGYAGAIRLRLSRFSKFLTYFVGKIASIFISIEEKPKLFICLALIGMFALYTGVRSSGYETHYDTALYHAQAVKWIKEYPVVPGLANVDSRLGMNSSWFIFCSFFDYGVVEHKVFHAANSSVYLFTFAFLLHATLTLYRKKFEVSGIFAALVILFLFLQGEVGDINSLSTDSISCFLGIYIFVYAIRYIEAKKHSIEDVFFLFIIALFATTIKLINITTVLLPLIFFIEWAISHLKQHRWQLKKVLHKELHTLSIFSGLFALFCFPWLVRNIIISGYLIFPIYQINLFSVDWKLPVEETKIIVRWIKSWARIPELRPEKVLDNGFFHWFRDWGHKELLRNMIMIPIILHLSVVVLFFSQLKEDVKKSWPIYTGAVFSVGYWFIMAPDPRFGYGFLVVLKAFLLSFLVLLIFNNIKSFIRHFIVFLFVAKIVIYTISGISHVSDFPDSLKTALFPYRSHQPREYTSRHGVKIYVSEEAGYILPAAQKPRPDLEMRGDDYSDGFRSRKE